MHTHIHICQYVKLNICGCCFSCPLTWKSCLNNSICVPYVCFITEKNEEHVFLKRLKVINAARPGVTWPRRIILQNAMNSHKLSIFLVTFQYVAVGFPFRECFA